MKKHTKMHIWGNNYLKTGKNRSKNDQNRIYGENNGQKTSKKHQKNEQKRIYRGNCSNFAHFPGQAASLPRLQAKWIKISKKRCKIAYMGKIMAVFYHFSEPKRIYGGNYGQL